MNAIWTQIIHREIPKTAQAHKSTSDQLAFLTIYLTNINQLHKNMHFDCTLEAQIRTEKALFQSNGFETGIGSTRKTWAVKVKL